MDMTAVRSVGDQVYERLLGEIVAGGLAPGTVVNEPELADRMGVSRTPVREALGRLAGDGLVSIRRNRRAVVRSLTAVEVSHVYQVREALEAAAARSAAGKLTADEIKLLRRLATAARGSRGSPEAVAAHHRFDVELHRLCAERSGNPVLADEIRKYRDLVQLVRNQVGEGGGAMERAFREHVALVDALAAGDAEAAARTMADHIRGAARAAVSRFPCPQSDAAATPKARAAAKPQMLKVST